MHETTTPPLPPSAGRSQWFHLKFTSNPPLLLDFTLDLPKILPLIEFYSTLLERSPAFRWNALAVTLIVAFRLDALFCSL